jgi:hypothetical protein
VAGNCLYVIDLLRLMIYCLTCELLGILGEIGVSDCCGCSYGVRQKPTFGGRYPIGQVSGPPALLSAIYFYRLLRMVDGVRDSKLLLLCYGNW